MEARSHLNRDMDMGSIVVIGIVSILLVVEIAIGMQTWFYSVRDEQMFTKSTQVQNPAMARAYETQQQHIAHIDEQAIEAYVQSVPAKQGRSNITHDHASH